MKTSLAWPRAGWFSSVRTIATFVSPISERERRDHFGRARDSRHRFPSQATTAHIFTDWFHGKISNSIGLPLGGEAVVSWAQVMRYTAATAASARCAFFIGFLPPLDAEL